MKKSLLWLAPLFLFLVVACGNDFHAHLRQEETLVPSEDMDFQQPESRSQIKGEDGTYEIVRHSKTIVLNKVETKTDKDQFVLSADLMMNGKNQGPIEMVGQASGNETVLVPSNPELKNKYRAKVVCTSGDDSCSDYFVDFFIRDGKTVYVDQYVKAASKDASTTTSTTSTTSTTTTSVALPKSDSKTATTAAPPATLPQIPVIIPAPQDDDSSYDSQTQISDGDANEKVGGFVGTSDKEILSLFEVPKIEKPEVPKPTVAPVAPGKVETPAAPDKDQQTSPVQIQEPTSVDQAINLPYQGRLQNATSLLSLVQDQNYPFKIMWPNKGTHFATANMAEVLKTMAEFMQKKMKDFKLTLGDVSSIHGGPLLNKYGRESHKGHQNGTDADISYVVKTPSKELTSLVSKGKLSHELMLPEQWSLMKEAFQTGQTLIIFVDPVIKMALCYEAQQEGDLKNRSDRGAGYEVLRRIHTLSGHNTHFHLRIKCGNGDSRCRNQIWSYGDSGCFGGK